MEKPNRPVPITIPDRKRFINSPLPVPQTSKRYVKETDRQFHIRTPPSVASIFYTHCEEERLSSCSLPSICERVITAHTTRNGSFQEDTPGPQDEEELYGPPDSEAEPIEPQGRVSNLLYNSPQYQPRGVSEELEAIQEAEAVRPQRPSLRGMSPVNSFTESEMENMQPVGHEIDKSNWRSDKYINVLGIGMEYPAGTSPKTMSKVSSKLRACQPSKISIRSPKKSTKKQKEQAPTVDITHITYNEVRSPTPSVSRTLSIRSWRLPKFQTAEKSSDTQSGNYTGAVISTPRPMSFGRVFQRPPVQVIGNPSRHSYYKSDVDGSDLSLRGSSAPESTDGRMSVPFKLVTQPLRAHSAGDLSTQNRSSFKPRFCRPRWPTDPQNLNYAASSASETSEEIEKFWHSQITNNDISFPVFSRVPVHQNGASLSRPGWAFDSEQDTQAVWRDATLEIPSETPQLLHTNTSLNNSPLSITTPTNCMSFFPVPSSPVSSHLYSPRTEQEGDLYLQPERPQSRWSNYSEKETTSLRHHISTWSQMIRSSSGTSVDYGQKPLQSSEYLSAPEMIKSFSTQSARRDKEQLFRTSFLHQAKESVKHAIQRAESDSPSPRTSTSNESLDTEKKSSVQGRARHAEKKSDGKEKRSRTTEVFTKMIPGRGRREKGRYEEERRRALLKAKIRVIHSDSDGVLI